MISLLATFRMAKVGTSVHSTSMLSQLSNGKMAILTGRGGGHHRGAFRFIDDRCIQWWKHMGAVVDKGYPAAQNANWGRNGVHFFLRR